MYDKASYDIGMASVTTVGSYERVNPLIQGAMFNKRDLYPQLGGQSTAEETTVNVAEQQAVDPTIVMEPAIDNPKKAGSMALWLVVIVGGIILIQLGALKGIE